MLTLFRTDCSTDWKCRPSHSLMVIAKSDDRQTLIDAMNSDVEKWQAGDITNDNEILQEDADETGDSYTPVTKWERDEEDTCQYLNLARFEMSRNTRDADMREFVIHDREGDDRITIAYHILDI